jgi:hypothetical protein
VLEKLAEYLFAGGSLKAIPEYVATDFTWDRFAAIQIWIFVLFLIYRSIEELNARLGNGELMKIFFTRRSPVIKPTLPAESLRGAGRRTETHTPNRPKPNNARLLDGRELADKEYCIRPPLNQA